MFKFNPFKSLTIWGALGAIGTVATAHFDPSALSPTASTILTAAGTLVSILGLRNSQAKTEAYLAGLVEDLAKKGR